MRARTARVEDGRARGRRLARAILVALAGLFAVAALFMGFSRSRIRILRVARARFLGGVLLQDDGVIFQNGRADCGPTALRMACRQLRIPDARADETLLGSESPWGASIFELAERSRSAGLGPTLTPAGFRALERTKLPAIVLLGTHFVLLESRPSASELIVLDPSIGRYLIPASRLTHELRGLILSFHPVSASSSSPSPSQARGAPNTFTRRVLCPLPVR